MELDNTQNRFRSVSNNTIDRSKLKRSQYMLSLPQEGQQAGVITSQRAYQIQAEIMQILQRIDPAVYPGGKYVGHDRNS